MCTTHICISVFHVSVIKNATRTPSRLDTSGKMGWMTNSNGSARPLITPAVLMLVCGVVAALHVGKLPTALPVLRESFGLSLVQSGFLLSIVLLAGMSGALILGTLANRLGLRRCMFAGLMILMLGSAAATWATSASQLMSSRAVEGLGFLLVALTAPPLIRRHVPPERLQVALGSWGAFMPAGNALALLFGPWVMGATSWQLWWWVLALVALVWAMVFRASIAPDPVINLSAPSASNPEQSSWKQLLWLTISHRGPWLVALTFGCYTLQWMAIIGFLPTIYQESGIDIRTAGALTALVSLVNISGNVASGWLLRHGVPAQRLLLTGFAVMALGAWLSFGLAQELPPLARYLAILLFSAVGGLIPGTLFNLAVVVAPSPQAVPPTVGWMLQWSFIGQFAGPPLVAWVAQTQGNWNQTWWVTGGACLAGSLLALILGTPAKR
jgi:MFS transporter, CP family, cyanate transporter